MIASAHELSFVFHASSYETRSVASDSQVANTGQRSAAQRHSRSQSSDFYGTQDIVSIIW